jgi:hypothetical protein
MTNDCSRAYDLTSGTVSYFGGSSVLIVANQAGNAAWSVARTLNPMNLKH